MCNKHISTALRNYAMADISHKHKHWHCDLRKLLCSPQILMQLSCLLPREIKHSNMELTSAAGNACQRIGQMSDDHIVNMFLFLLTSEDEQIGSVYQLSTLGSNTGGKEYILYGSFVSQKKNKNKHNNSSALVSKQVCRES